MNNSMHTAISAKTRPLMPIAPLISGKFPVMDDDEIFTCPVGITQNDLLASLPEKELAFLLKHLEFVYLSYDKELFSYGEKLSYVYFPTTAIIALLYLMPDGATTEIGVTGHEGMLGASILFSDSAVGTAKVQISGGAYRLKTSVLKEVCANGGKLQSLLMRYTQALFAQMVQNSVCGRHYSVDQQLSRWLLDRLDRLSTNELKATQEMIANMLGVRRESITQSVGKLQARGVIQCRRGNITVLDRELLESYAGECYTVAKREFDSVLTQ